MYSNKFDDPDRVLDLEKQRFYLVKKILQVVIPGKSWERRLNQRYDGFTDIEDVENTLDAILERRQEQINAMFPKKAEGSFHVMRLLRGIQYE